MSGWLYLKFLLHELIDGCLPLIIIIISTNEKDQGKVSKWKQKLTNQQPDQIDKRQGGGGLGAAISGK